MNVISSSVQHMTCSAKKLSTGESFFVSFVYGLNTQQERRLLWNELLSCQTIIGDAPWCLMGDFNVCLGPDETNNCTSWSSSMLEFRDFIVTSSLLDLSCSGPALTWWDSCKSNPVFKKLDRCLVNDSWLQKFPLSKSLVLPRGLSDHCPITIDMGLDHKSIRKPFQFFNHLLAAPGFFDLVKNSWSKDVQGDPWYVLTSKLKFVKCALKDFNSARGDIHTQVEAACVALLDFQLSLPVNPSVHQFEEESNLKITLQNLLLSEEVVLKQKSGVHWLQNGDGNNRFFFNACKARWNTNKILVLQDGD